jgi:hypothetical protein
MIVAKTVKGGWLFQSAGEESASEEQAHAPGFDVYVFKDDATAKEAFELFSNAQSSGEFGGGGTYVSKNIVIDTDQTPPGSLDSFADTLLKRCTGSSATQSLHRSEESSTEGTASETSTEGGEVGAPGQANHQRGRALFPSEPYAATS